MEPSKPSENNSSSVELSTKEYLNKVVFPADPFNQVSSPPICHSIRVREFPHHLRDNHCYSTIFSHHESLSCKEASSNPLWQKVMTEELQALEKCSRLGVSRYSTREESSRL